MQRLDLAHPGEGDLVVGPLSLGDNREFVFAGAFKRPVVAGSNIFDHRERVTSGIDSAFEQGHAVSTSCLFAVFDTHAVGPARAPPVIAGTIPRSRCCGPGISAACRGSTDVICGICATGCRVRPQVRTRSSTAHLTATILNEENKQESDSPKAPIVNSA